jgi:hypothetical protein
MIVDRQSVRIRNKIKQLYNDDESKILDDSKKFEIGILCFKIFWYSKSKNNRKK